MIRRAALLAAGVLLPALLLVTLFGALERGDAESVPARSPAVDDAPTGILAALDRAAGHLVRPGALAAPHEALEGIAACLDCHGAGSGVPDARCLGCHEEIGARAREALPLHGTLQGACAGCHPDHLGLEARLIDLDRASFQHAATRFALEGSHAPLDCEACHRLVVDDGTRFHYQGVPFASCADCHRDPHAPGVGRNGTTVGEIRRVGLAPAPAPPRPSDPDYPLAGRDCAGCHGAVAFSAGSLRPEGFRHDVDTRYALRGPHARVRCDSCHTEERSASERAESLPPGRGTPRDCGACHRDPHAGALGEATACARCHVEEAWTRGFSHDRDTRFALDPLHATLACARCHEDGGFTAAGRTCEACHADAAGLLAGSWGGASGEPDPHAHGVPCGDCHGPSPEDNSPAGLGRRCTACHPPAYAPLLATWRSTLDALATRTAAPGERVERLRASGVHNFPLARRLLEVEAGTSGRPEPARSTPGS